MSFPENLKPKVWSTLMDSLPETIVDIENKASISGIFDAVPPFSHAIIEGREHPYSPQIDLMFCVIRRKEEHKLLEDWIYQGKG